MKSITAEKISKHINFLASDALLGRNTPSAGLDSAAAYIANEFNKYGLQKIKGSYFQPVPLSTPSLGDSNYVNISYKGQTRSLQIKTGFVPYEISGDTLVKGEVIFAGYGITAPEFNYDDYKNIDAKGKIVLVLRHEPGEESDSSYFSGKKATRYSDLSTKVDIAIKNGAIGMLLVTDPLNHQLIAPKGYAWPSLSAIIPKDAQSVILKENNKTMPVVHVGKEVMELFFESIDSLRKVQYAMDNNGLEPSSLSFKGSHAAIKTEVIDIPAKSNNVMGFLEGSDPVLKNEIVVIGAHYDHVGFKTNHTEKEDYIFNGADDNASGTSAVLSVAEAFFMAKVKPKRSILFITFSGEELGLYGSKAYTLNPLFPLNKTVAMLNMDMIGRNGPDTLYLEGAAYSPDLTDIVTEKNKQMGFKLITESNTFFGGSDHANFYNKDIPFVFFFSGLHPDYHTVRDNPQLVNTLKLSRVTQLVFLTAWHIANDNKHYRIIKK